MLVVIPDSNVYRNPEISTLADALGTAERFDPATVFDVAVVGAGLAAAVYAASEGLTTVVIEERTRGARQIRSVVDLRRGQRW